MSLTRNCIFPWEVMVIHGGGYMCPCCAMNDADYGDFLLDYIEPLQKGEAVEEVFNNEAIQNLKKGLLTGNLRPMCQNCSIIPKDLISVTELQNKVEIYLKSKGVIITNDADFTKLYALDRIWFGITNKCNLRCIYCNQSLLADTNPYFKVDFPREASHLALEFFASKGVEIIETGAFGESTIHPNWYPIFRDFHEKYPNIKLCLNTNLCKEYTEEEIKLLAEHSFLRISIDTMEEELFSKIRKNGSLRLVKKNIQKIEDAIVAYQLEKPQISIDAVICSATWKSMMAVSEYAFSYGYAFSANNYEERPNSIGYRDCIITPVEQLEPQEQKEIARILDQIREKAENDGMVFSCSSLSSCVNTTYNRFIPYEENPILEAFYSTYITGTEDMHLEIVYDYSNLSYEGILLSRNVEKLELEVRLNCSAVIIREVEIYKQGTFSPKYKQAVLPGYRKRVECKEGKFIYTPVFRKAEIESILLQVVQ